MARPLRLEYPGALYHITSRGNERKKIYRDEKDYSSFLEILAQVVEGMDFVLHAYCLMPNHYHILVETREANLSKGMRQLNGVYTQKFNYRHKRSGHLLQGRYKAILVEKEAHLLELCRYMVLNPLRAKMVEREGEWFYSSYRATAGLSPVPSFLYTDWILASFGKRRKKAQEAYRRFVAEGADRPSPWSHLIGQIYLGGEGFRRELKRALEQQLNNKEIPQTQRQPLRASIESILDLVARAYEIAPKNLTYPREGGEARQVAIYLCRKLSGLSLSVIASCFGVTYTRVSQVAGRIDRGLESDKHLRKAIEALEKELA